MNQKILFSETQRFTQWWIWTIFIVTNGILLAGCYIQLVLGKPFGDKPMSDTGLILITTSLLPGTLLFFLTNFKTEITKDAVYFKYFPFHFGKRSYGLKDIADAKVISYHPLQDYGGWGIRYGKNGKAFNVKGNKGLFITFKDGKKRLLGTQKPDELQRVIKELGFGN